MSNNNSHTEKASWVALLPLMTFIVLYLVISIVMGDFYKVPITVAFLISAIVAVGTLRHRSFQERMRIFSRGACSENMILMIIIFILAGAFSSSAKAMGSIDATVDLALNIMPSSMLMAGLFIASCFISLAVGTSVGTIVALVPIAAGIASQTGTSIPLLTGIITGGAFFGDNLSFISDTTVVATQSQGCKMSDKFKANLLVVAPAAIVCLILYIIIGVGANIGNIDSSDVNYILVLPYIVVLVAAICGLNVLGVLCLGCILTGTIGIACGKYDIFGWMQAMNSGILNMSELILVTMLAGGMLEIIRINGGINHIIKAITRHINGRRGGELSIAMLVALIDVCTANNTVAIITTGPLVKQISERFSISPRRAASLLDTFSCIAQGIIPYGAQLLMAAGLAAITPTEIIPYMFYTFALTISALVFIFIKKKDISNDTDSNNNN